MQASRQRKTLPDVNGRMYFADYVRIAIASLTLFFGASCYAQTFQFLPETDVSAGLDSNVRFTFQAKETRENGEPTQGEIGPSIEFNLKELEKLFSNNVDRSKTRLILLSFGYRYLPFACIASKSGGHQHRAKRRFPLKYGFLQDAFIANIRPVLTN